MINFKNILVIVGLVISYSLQGQDISEETARIVAKNFINLTSKESKKLEIQLTNITEHIDKRYDGFYIFNIANGKGFFIISSESLNHPVLAYSFDSPISTEKVKSPEFLYILNGYQSANEYLRQNKFKKNYKLENSAIKAEWETLVSEKKISSDKNTKELTASSVSPLLKTTWSQAPYYNKLVPKTYEGKSCFTGCVATAMAQIMKFWNYPTKGNGLNTYTILNSYYDWKGKTLTTNFGNTTYLWGNMPNSLSKYSSTQQIDAVATLMLHAGTSVKMNYGPSASGASSSSVFFALKNYFKYSPDIVMKSRSSYSNDTEWLNLVKEQLAKGYPVYFSGHSSSGGHAFIADGYDTNNLIHFNLGWGGQYDGYYQISNPYGYSQIQTIITNIYPMNKSFCSSPSGLKATNITFEQAILKWDAFNNAQNYTIEYKRRSSPNWIIANLKTKETSFTLKGLEVNTTYDWRVKIYCSNSSNSVYSQSSFSTLGTCPSPSGLRALNIHTYGATLTWNRVQEAQNYTLEYKFPSSSEWTVAAAKTSSTGFGIASLSANTTYNWRVKTNCSELYQSVYSQSNFTTFPKCSTPTDLNILHLSANSVMLKWKAESGDENYTVEYRLSTNTEWTVAATSITGTDFKLYGLKTDATYFWRIKTNCSSSNNSGYRSSSFTTLTSCPVPTNLNVSNLSSGSAILRWANVSGAQDYTVEYKPNTDANWIVATNSTTETYFELSGLKSNTTYLYRIKTNCSASYNSGYIESSFNTPSICHEPSGLNIYSSPSIGSVVFRWNPVSGAQYYSVEYKISSAVNWEIATRFTTATLLPLSGLKNDTTYLWRVKTNCSGYNNSDYTQANFKTPYVSPCIINYEPNESFADAIPINTNITYYAGIGSTSDMDYYKFTINNTSNVIVTLQDLPKNYDLKVYNNSQAQIGSSSAGGTSNKTITLNNLEPGTYYVYVYGYMRQFDLTHCYGLRVNSTSTSNKISESNNFDSSSIYNNTSITLYPNPVENTLFINGLISDNDEYVLADILDRNGKIVKTATIKPAKEITLDVSELTPNLYFLRIQNSNFKFIKK